MQSPSINTKVSIQAQTPNSGEKKRFFQRSIPVGIAAVVKGVASIPANSHPITATLSFNNFFILFRIIIETILVYDKSSK